MPLIDYKTSLKELIAINCNNNCNNIDNNAKEKEYSLENELKLAPTAKDFELKLSTTPIITSNRLKENNNLNQRYSNNNKKNIEIFLSNEEMLQDEEEDECLWEVTKEIIGAFI